MSFDPHAPYGPLVESTIRVVTWNVWGRYGPDHEARGIGFVSRWPMTEPRRHPLRAEDGSGSGEAVHVAVAAERGPIQLFAVLLDYPLAAVGLRQQQVRQLVRFIAETLGDRGR